MSSEGPCLNTETPDSAGTPETDARVQKVSRYSNVPGGPRIEIVPAEVSRRLERRLAVQTATAQSLRLIVERAVELLGRARSALNFPGIVMGVDDWTAQCDAFLSEIRERKE